MNAQAILDKILQDAKENASATLRDANDRAQGMKKASDERIAAARAQTEARAKQDAEAATARMQRMAELDERKLLLADKRRMMDQAFALALTKMKAMPAAQARAFLLTSLTELAEGDETLLVGAENDGWMDDKFLADANAALAAKGKPARLTLSEEARPFQGGRYVQDGSVEVNCTFAALLRVQREHTAKDVAAILFD